MEMIYFNPTTPLGTS